MAKKASLGNLAKQLNKPDKPKKIDGSQGANAPRGERSDYLKVTITLPPEIWAALKNIGVQRKSSGEHDYDVSSLIREAVVEWLKSNK